MDKRTKRIVLSALMASLTCVATMIIKIPTPLQGYINLGDCIVLLSAWTLGPVYGFAASGVGSLLADLLSGYGVYAPVTFVIKGGMALIAYFLHRVLKGKIKDIPATIISATVAELVMVGGYYVFEGIMYGFSVSLVNIPANLIQGVGGIIFGVILVKAIGKHISVER